MATEKTILQQLDELCPPFWCCAWAREKPRGKQATTTTLAKRSGISYRTVQRIRGKISWSGLSIDVISAFLKACGIRTNSSSIIRLNEIRAYQRWSKKADRRAFCHLSQFQWKLFNQRSKLWLERQDRNGEK